MVGLFLNDAAITRLGVSCCWGRTSTRGWNAAAWSMPRAWSPFLAGGSAKPEGCKRVTGGTEATGDRVRRYP